MNYICLVPNTSYYNLNNIQVFDTLRFAPHKYPSNCYEKPSSGEN